jgi:hypothetical protein
MIQSQVLVNTATDFRFERSGNFFGEARDCHVRFEVFTAVIMKNCVFWDVTPCGSCKNRRLVFLRSVRRLLVTASVVPSSPILVILMKEALKFLRNVGSYKSHTASHPRKHDSSRDCRFHSKSAPLSEFCN